MQQNPGFLVLYSFIKDALLSKVGVVKVWWETREEHERETYLDQPADAFALIVADPAVEVIAHSEHSMSRHQGVDEQHQPAKGQGVTASAREDGRLRPDVFAGDAGSAPMSSRAMDGREPDILHDVTVQTKRSYECARVEGVPPEEFGIARNARSIRDADYCFHDVLRSEAKLIEQGYDREQIKRLPSYVVADTIEAQARDTVNEGTQGQGDDGVNSASRLVRVTEHYVRMDYEGNDKTRIVPGHDWR